MAGLTCGIREFEEDIYSEYSTEVKEIIDFYGPTDISKTNDELVPFGQSCMLYDKLKACGKTAKLYAVENAHHGGREFWSEQVLGIVTDFITDAVEKP